MKREGLSRSKLLGIVIFASLILSFLVGLLFWNWFIIEIKEIPIEVEVTNTTLIGFNTGTDKLYFGTVGQEGLSERRATVVSAEDSIMTVKIRGAVDSWVTVSENNIRLWANEPREITFRLTAPSDAEPGNYTGIATIQYRRALFGR